MALRRRRRKDAEGNFIDTPVECGICKKETTIFTVHGGIATGWVGGKTCCDKCFETIKTKEQKQDIGNNGKSEAEYQIERRWGL